MKREDLVELCWNCHQPLDPDTAVTKRRPWPSQSTYRICPGCALAEDGEQA